MAHSICVYLVSVYTEIKQAGCVDLPLALGMFGVGELLFCYSIVMILKEAGQRASWDSIFSFKFRELKLGSPRMMGWLWVNRLSWIVPWLVVITMSLGKVPWVVTVAALGEVGVTFGLGVIISLGLRIPWWNDGSGNKLKKATTGGKALIRRVTKADIPALVALELEVWGRGAANEWQLAQRIANAPRGNILAVHPDGRVCGYISFSRLDYDTFASRGLSSWYDLSGHGTASTHDPNGPDLFGISLGVAPWAPRDTSHQLFAETAREGFRSGVQRAILGARIPKYYKHAHRLTAEEYLRAERRPGIPLDPELHYYFRAGLSPIRLVKDYFDDPESLNWGVIVEIKVPAPIRLLGPVIARLPLAWRLLMRG